MSVAGAREDYNAWMIDGTDMSSGTNNTPGSALGVQLGVDTIREYQVITSDAKAEYPRGGGGIINAVTRSGTNQLHGSLFEFIRNSDIDARNFYNPGSLPPFKRNQFGGTLGGPVKKDKSFFFLSYEGVRQRLSTDVVYNVPTAAGRQGIGVLAAGQTVAPSVVPYLNLYPLPNGTNLGGGIGQYTGLTYQPGNEDYGSGRFDQHLSDSDSFFGRWTVDKADNHFPAQLISPISMTTANQYITLQEDHIFNASLLNMFRVGYNRSIYITTCAPPVGSQGLGFAPGLPLGTIGAGGLSSMGVSNNYPDAQGSERVPI